MTEQLTLSHSPSGRLVLACNMQWGVVLGKSADGPKELQGVDNGPIMEATGRESLTGKEELFRGESRDAVNWFSGDGISGVQAEEGEIKTTGG